VARWRRGKEAMPTILLADDSEVTRLLLKAQLESLGAQILEAADGQAAVDLARAAHPRVAVLDMEMPRLNGFEVCTQLKADPATADIRVVILTARTEDDVQGYALAAGADCYLTKPWDPQGLPQQIVALLAG
jgi:CheY-like chemotaxis protein